MKSPAKIAAQDNSEAFERRLPYSQEAEACVLGAMLMDKEAIGRSIEMLAEDCFYLDNHRKLFKAIVSLYEKSVEVDPVTLTEQLKKEGALEEIGGMPFIYEISNSVPTAANVIYHAQIVSEKSMLRKLIEGCTTIIEEAYQPVEDVDKLVDEAEERIFKVQDFRLREGLFPIRNIVHDIISDLEYRAQHDITMTGLPSGFRNLDKLTVGFQKSN